MKHTPIQKRVWLVVVSAALFFGTLVQLLPLSQNTVFAAPQSQCPSGYTPGSIPGSDKSLGCYRLLGQSTSSLSSCPAANRVTVGSDRTVQIYCTVKPTTPSTPTGNVSPEDNVTCPNGFTAGQIPGSNKIQCISTGSASNPPCPQGGIPTTTGTYPTFKVYCVAQPVSNDPAIARKTLQELCKNNDAALQQINNLSDDGALSAVKNSAAGCDAAVAYMTNNLGIAPQPTTSGPECGSSTSSLSWLICPAFDLTQKSADTLNGIITNMLDINTCQIFGTTSTSHSSCTVGNNDTAKSFKSAWSSMRNIAILVIVIAALVMIIAQAIGSQAIDAYTIKSVLPRLLIAAVFIALSWYVMEFLVQFSNVLGEGVRTLIYSPFSSLNSGATQGVMSGSGGIGALLGGGLALSVGVILLIAFAGTLLLALMVGLLVIVLRQIAVIFLIIVAPIAIAAYALPGTKKGFKLWWDSLFKALMMFPLIVAFIAIGRVFAAVLLATGGWVQMIIAIIAYVIPFFLLPFTLKLSGGAMGAIGGALHTQSQKVNGMIAKRRGARWADRGQRFKTGELRGPGRSLNNLGRHVGAGALNGFGFTQRGRSQMRLAEGARVQSTLKSHPELMQLALENDDANAVLALSGGTSAGARQAALDLFGDTDRARNALRSIPSGSINRSTATAALTTMAQNKSRAVGDGHFELVQAGINRLSGGDAEQAASLAHTFAFNSRQAGRLDLGGHWNDMNVDAGLEGVAGSNFAGRLYGGNDQNARAALTTMDGLRRTTNGAFLQSQAASMQHNADVVTDILTNPQATEVERHEAATRLLEFHKNINGASGGNQQIINTTLHNAGVDLHSNESVASQIARIANLHGQNADLELDRTARVFASEVPPGARGGEDIQPPAAPFMGGGEE